MKHTKFICDCDDTRCNFCNGGLFLCTVCGGAEGTLTTDCCGRKLTEDEEMAIYDDAVLDFKDGKWVAEPNYPRSQKPHTIELFNADPNCEHNIEAAPGGGIRCTKCPGWFCY